MRRLLLLGLLLLWPSMAGAADLYVNNSGSPECSDATTKANNTALAPWCTIARAAWGSTTYASPSTSEAAAAGDTVYITAGTYTEDGNTDSTASVAKVSVALNPANSGSSGNPITFRGVGDVYIRLNTDIYGPMIGARSGKNYIVWDNFIIDDTYGGSASDFGPVAFIEDSTHGQLINSEVMGHNGSYNNGRATFGGNYRLITLENAWNTTIKNNVIHRAHLDDTGVGGQNEGGIIAYDSNNVIIEHNEIYDCGAGIFIKGIHAPDTQADNIIRYNYIHDNDNTGIRLWGADRTLVYQNIVTNSLHAIWVTYAASCATDGNCESNRIINNTSYNSDYGIVVQETQVDFHAKNNLIVGNTYGIYSWTNSNPTGQGITFTRNVYYGTVTAHANYGSGNINFTDWQGTYSLDVDGTNGTDPLFVSAGPTAAAHFKLQSGSPALTVGRVVESIGGTNGDTIPVGAYISAGQTEEIGLESGVGGGSDIVIRRFAPFNLRR